MSSALTLPTDINSARGGYLYVARDSDDNTKVGFSRNVGRRLSELRAGSSRGGQIDAGIHLLGAIASRMEMEQFFHGQFAAQRAEIHGQYAQFGEWYRPLSEASSAAEFIMNNKQSFDYNHLKTEAIRVIQKNGFWNLSDVEFIATEILTARPDLNGEDADFYLCCANVQARKAAFDVLVESMAPEQLEEKERELLAMGKGCFQHAMELKRYRQDRKEQAA